MLDTFRLERFASAEISGWVNGYQRDSNAPARDYLFKSGLP